MNSPRPPDASVPETCLVPAGAVLRTEPDGTSRSVGVGPFRLGRTPVTNLQFASFLSGGSVSPPSWWTDPRFARPGQPVVGVSWNDAAAYCRWLSVRSGLRFRLPGETEWEHAACGGLVAPRTTWGEAIPPGEIPSGPLEGPWDVGQGRPNGYGLLDMGTIVHEWCLDLRDSGDRARRASRGGSWRHAIRWSPPSARSSLPPEFRYSDYGFRVLQEQDG